jgi:hypothetical protein
MAHKVGIRVAPNLVSRSSIVAQQIATKHSIPQTEDSPYTISVDNNGISLCKSPHKPVQLDFYDKELQYKSK